MVSNVVEDLAYRDREFVFKDRQHAGQLLAKKLRAHLDRGSTQLLALPAGGVPVAYAISKTLTIPFDVIVVRKIQIPWNTEAGFGAVTWDGRVLVNRPLVEQLGLDARIAEQCISRTREMVHERIRKFRGDRPFPDLSGKTVILVDDGLASGFTMMAAVESMKAHRPRKTIIAVPTASRDAVDLLASSVDLLICLNVRSRPIFAVADAYEKWYDLSDSEVLWFLGSCEHYSGEQGELTPH